MFTMLREQPIRMDDEGLSTLCCEIENILNNRPLTQISDQPNDLEYLTPNHLLLLGSSAKCAPGVFTNDSIYLRKKWKQLQYFANLFWSRWSKQYLAMLQERQKWQQPQHNLKENDIVLLVENTPRNAWSLGRVVNAIQDTNGLVRIVRVKTKNKILERPVHKLCLFLEANEEK